MVHCVVVIDEAIMMVSLVRGDVLSISSAQVVLGAYHYIGGPASWWLCVCEYHLYSFPKRPRVHADGSAVTVVRAVVVLPPRGVDGSALAVRLVIWQETLAHGGAALEGEAQLAPVPEVVDNVVAVDGALWRCNK